MSSTSTCIEDVQATCIEDVQVHLVIEDVQDQVHS